MIRSDSMSAGQPPPPTSLFSVKSTDHKVPSYFPCASRVKICQVGADETELKPHKTINIDRPTVKRSSGKSSPAVDSGYVKKISAGLSFSEDVVRDRGFHTLPYDTKYFQEVLDTTGFIVQPPKAKHPTGRHNARGADNKHIPCHIKTRSTHRLKPMHRKILERAIQMHQDAIDKKVEEIQSSKETQDDSPESPVFLTEAPPMKERSDSDPDTAWDEYLMSILSETTARWISNKQVSPGSQQEKLNGMLNTYYGAMDEFNKIELVRESISDGDLTKRSTVSEETKTSRWKKPNECMLDRVRRENAEKPRDPYSDAEDNNAAFYRLPAGFRRAKHNQEKEEAGACNTTAYNIQVKRQEIPPPPTLKDFVSEGAGKTVYQTDNMYQQELLTEVSQMRPLYEDSNKIVMETNNKYRKQIQTETPRIPQTWFPSTDKEKEHHESTKKNVKVYEKGMRRWNALPEPIDDTAEKLQLLLPGSDAGLSESPDPNLRKRTRDNSTLVQIVTDWRNKWNLDMRYADANPKDLIKDMADIHVHIRLKAVTTCARAAEYRPPPEPGIQLDSQSKKDNQVKLLPEELFIALSCCLDDAHEQVRRAAAITLYTLERPNDHAEEILRGALLEAKSVDRWTAAQCLAYYGECDSEVVGELVYQLLNTEDNIRHERAAFLLSKLSENSTLVHSMLGEQLNSSSWRHRVMATKIMPKLYGNINKDLVHKLSHLMWTDWHSEVRKAAAQTLGKTGHGKDVHDQLLDKILDGHERDRVEAVSKIGHLGIMTAKLMPVFLDCFSDSYVSVRMEACLSCCNLRIKDQVVLDKLIYLATYDPIWKVKSHALKALGVVGVLDDKIRKCVLWALRYEDQPGVRAEACHTAVELGLRDQTVAQILQDRLLVETSPIVVDEIQKALETIGISPSEDMAMVAQIKSEVRKLCTRGNICAHISLHEKEDAQDANIERMIYKSPEQKKLDAEKKAGRQSVTQELMRRYPIPQLNNRVSFTPENELEAHYALEEQGSQFPLPTLDESSVLSSSDTASVTVSIPDSRPDSRRTGTPHSDKTDPEEDEEETSPRPRSRRTSALGRTISSMHRIKEEENGDDSSNNNNSLDADHDSWDEPWDTAEPEPEPQAVKQIALSDRQMYVEVNDATSAAGDDDVLKMKHISPAMSKATPAKSPTTPVGTTRDGDGETLASEASESEMRSSNPSQSETIVASPPNHSTPIGANP